MTIYSRRFSRAHCRGSPTLVESLVFCSGKKKLVHERAILPLSRQYSRISLTRPSKCGPRGRIAMFLRRYDRTLRRRSPAFTGSEVGFDYGASARVY